MLIQHIVTLYNNVVPVKVWKVKLITFMFSGTVQEKVLCFSLELSSFNIILSKSCNIHP